MDETSTLAFHRKDGSPAAGARVQLYGSEDTGVEPRVQMIADAQGGVEVPVPGRGFYNLVVRGRDGDALFQDSLYSNGTVFSIASDTLMRTGVLTGRIRVQPQHSPRIAWIHALGAGIWSNVDDSGRFRLDGLPAGKYTVAAYTLVEGYTPTFASVRTISDSTVDGGDIQMVFTGLPVVRNLEARFDTLAGLVYLRWDSISLRETWRYRIYRDDTLLGETAGPRWIDDVTGKYPGNTPSQGRSTYQVLVANADTTGPKWESITLQIVSAFLYQEVKLDWRRQGSLPWSGGIFQLDTANGSLVAWRSGEYGAELTLPGEGAPRKILSSGAIEKWTSADTGITWIKAAESMPISAFPVRFQGKWWSVRTPQASLVPTYSDSIAASNSLRPADLSRFDSDPIVMSSLDGIRWDSVTTWHEADPLNGFRMETDADGIWVVGSRRYTAMYAGYGVNDFSFRQFAGSTWSVRTAGQQGMPVMPVQGEYVSPWYTSRWDGGWWSLIGDGRLNGKKIRCSMSNDDFFDDARVVRMGPGKIALFGGGGTCSTDDSVSSVHAMAWPGGGSHFERMFGGKVVSVSDSGVYLGRILSGVSDGDPLGAWVKKTEVPVRY